MTPRSIATIAVYPAKFAPRPAIASALAALDRRTGTWRYRLFAEGWRRDADTHARGMLLGMLGEGRDE
jgi:hypothetical protein